MRCATVALVVGAFALLGLTGRGARAQEAALPAAVVAADGSGGAVESKLAEVDRALAELQSKLAELEQLRASLQTSAGSAAPPAAKEERWKYSGYAQVQVYTGPAAGIAGSSLQYQIRRFYHTLTYHVDEETQALLTLNTAIAKNDARVTPLNAYIERTEGDFRVRVGQFIPPASLDLIRSSSARHAHDYSRGYNTLFPEQYEPGLMVSSSSRNSHAGQVSLCVMSGNGLNNQDNDNAKNWILSYLQPFANGKGKVHVAYLDGTYTRAVSAAQTGTTVTDPKRIVSAGASYASGPWELQAEGLTGRAFGRSVRGGYLEAAYTTGRHTFFGRQDVYDPDTAAGGNAWVGPSLGYEYNWSARNRLSLEAAFLRNSATAGSDMRYQARWQVKW